MTRKFFFGVALLILGIAGTARPTSARSANLWMSVEPHHFGPGDSVTVDYSIGTAFCSSGPYGAGPVYLEIWANDGFWHTEYYPSNSGAVHDAYAGDGNRTVNYHGSVVVQCFDDYWEEYYFTSDSGWAQAAPETPYVARAVMTSIMPNAPDIADCAGTADCGGKENFHTDVYFELRDQWGDQWNERLVMWEQNELTTSPDCSIANVVETTSPEEMYRGFTDHIARCNSYCCESPNQCAIENDQTFFASDGYTSRVVTVSRMILFCDRVEYIYSF